MTAPRRGFDVPYGTITEANGDPTQSMSEYMDTVTKGLEALKTAAGAMTPLDPSTATASDCANAWEAFREALQEIE